MIYYMLIAVLLAQPVLLSAHDAQKAPDSTSQTSAQAVQEFDDIDLQPEYEKPCRTKKCKHKRNRVKKAQRAKAPKHYYYTEYEDEESDDYAYVGKKRRSPFLNSLASGTGGVLGIFLGFWIIAGIGALIGSLAH